MQLKINEDKLVNSGFEWDIENKHWELAKEMCYMKDTEVDTYYNYYLGSDDIDFDWYIPIVNLYVKNEWIDFIDEEDTIDTDRLVYYD